MGVSGLDIMHGHLKTLMLEAEENLLEAQKIESETGEAISSMERTYAEGYLDALTNLYVLTYNLSFALSEREQNGTN
jgi:hypothetical protein